MVPMLCVGTTVRDALRRRTLRKPQRTQSVLGCIPTRSVGTIKVLGERHPAGQDRPGGISLQPRGFFSPLPFMGEGPGERVLLMVPTLCVGTSVRDALRRRTLRKPQRTQSVLGCIPTRSVGTINFYSTDVTGS
jgi:hypothetical protein